MNIYSYEQLNNQIRTGFVYRRDMLLSYSKSLDRDLDTLLDKGLLRKLSGGLYYKPEMSELGTLPPNDNDLVNIFLRDDKFLLYSWNQYNSLGLGLTQLYNRVIVLNHKRHGVFKLVKKNIYNRLNFFDKQKLLRLSKKYGKISTKKFFEGCVNE